jgi:outer membrane lipoprotein carrier protein
VTRLAVSCAFAVVCLSAADTPKDLKVGPLLKAIESRYNRAQSLKLDFSETYTPSGRPAQSESGVLYLRKPGRMRWDYTSPEGKIFLSDGKDVFLYTPGDRTAEKTRLKESEDMRAPLAFLLGKLNFEKEFRSFSTRPEADSDALGGAPHGDAIWIIAHPKSTNLAYTEVAFLASADGSIHRVQVTGQDHSKLDFTFSNEKLNAPVSPGLFAFHPPPGVEVVDNGQ